MQNKEFISQSIKKLSDNCLFVFVFIFTPKKYFAVTCIEVSITEDFLMIYQVSRNQKYVISTSAEVEYISTLTTRDHSQSTYSERPARPYNNMYTAEWYTPDVAPSTLLWLVGPKDCLEDSIPEQGMFNFSSGLS